MWMSWMKFCTMQNLNTMYHTIRYIFSYVSFDAKPHVFVHWLSFTISVGFSFIVVTLCIPSEFYFRLQCKVHGWKTETIVCRLFPYEYYGKDILAKSFYIYPRVYHRTQTYYQWKNYNPLRFLYLAGLHYPLQFDFGYSKRNPVKGK